MRGGYEKQSFQGLQPRAAGFGRGVRHGHGLWLNDTAATAAVFAAVQPYSDAATRAAVQVYLLSVQQPDGSWASDPYVTALALRALFLVGRDQVIPQPTYKTGEDDS